MASKSAVGPLGVGVLVVVGAIASIPKEVWVFVVIFGIIAAVLIAIYWSSENAKRQESLNRFLDLHADTLAKKRWQMVQQDAYGKENVAKWEKEKKYFIKHVLNPHLESVGRMAWGLDDAYLLDTIEQRALGVARPSADISSVADGHDYEHFVAGLLRKNGWTARVTKASGDQGCDIVGQHGSLLVVFQCKLYSGPVGNKAVQEVSAAKLHEKADLGVVVTNREFTRSAAELAKTTGTILIHHDEIGELFEIINREIDGSAGAVVSGPWGT